MQQDIDPLHAAPAPAGTGANDVSAGWSWFESAPPLGHATPAVPVALPAREPPRREGADGDGTLIRSTLQAIGPQTDKLVSYFYSVLFLRHPELREMFPAAMEQQRDRLMTALLKAVSHIDNEAELEHILEGLGRGHRKYGTLPEHYPAVGEALMDALGAHAGAAWTPAAEDAWARAYTKISQIMIDAAAAAEAAAPAWWTGEIVDHEQRSGDVAVIQVRPDEPYPFRAGQYASLETPWWPRVWRQYSLAGKPRADGLLTFHVKAVPGGWVSTALARRARPGDRIRLGPPAGTMTLDHHGSRDVLCLGGGTGMAPIKALVEDVAAHGGHRSVEVFYGARRDRDLYDLKAMRDLEREHPWLTVHTVLSDEPTGDLTGTLTDIVRTRGPWGDREAFLSGPPAMIRGCIMELAEGGLPTSRLHYDDIAH